MFQLSKLQIRAKVMSAVSKIKSLKYHNEKELQSLTEELEEIEDKKTLFDIFLKEFIKLEEEDYNFCACLIKNLIPVSYISEKSIESLASLSLSDDYKYKIVQLLRITGGEYSYSDLPGYFENPKEIMDLETKRLLSSAVFNPESMLDFLDFVSAVSANDRNILLKSLFEDYQGDMLANIVYPILYSKFEDEFVLQAINVLSDSKSSLAIAPFEYLIQVSDNQDIINACKKGLKILKLAGASKEKADEYFKNIIKNSQPYLYFVTIPDGSGQQALLATRKQDNGKYSLCAVVISDLTGVKDCFGFFSITQEEVAKIIKKFYRAEGQFAVSGAYVKSRLNFAQKLNVENQISYPYEFICWSPSFYDLSPLLGSLENYVDENAKIVQISKETAIDVIASEYTLRWFILPSDNKILYDLTESIYNRENLDISFINLLVTDNIHKIFDEKMCEIWKNRLYNLIYILIGELREEEANCFYTILKDEKLFALFKNIIIQRSIFNYFAALKDNTKDSLFKKNIFIRRNSNEKSYSTKRLDEIIRILKRGWIDK